jgi:hypothetical protein
LIGPPSFDSPLEALPAAEATEGYETRFLRDAHGDHPRRLTQGAIN